MANADTTLNLFVVTKADNAGLTSAQRELAGLNKATESASIQSRVFGTAFQSMSKMVGAFTIAGAIQQLPGLLSDASRAAADDAASVSQLGQALKNAGLEEFTGAMEQAAQGAMRFGVADEEARRSLSLLVAQTGSAEDAQARFKIAMDLSRGANIELSTAARLVGRVSDENTNVLSRYGVTIAKGASETEALAAISAKFSGQAQAFADGPAGSMARFNLAIGEAQESLGRLIGPVLTIGAEAGIVAMELLAGSFEVVIAAGKVLVDGLGLIGGAADSLLGSIGLNTAKTEELSTEQQFAADAAREFSDAEAQAAKTADVLTNMLEKQINSLGLTKMGFTDSVVGIQRHQEAIANLTATYGELSQAQQNYLLGISSPYGTFTGGVLTFPQARQMGGPVEAGKLYRVNEAGQEYFRPSVAGSVVPLGGQGGGGTAWNLTIVNQGTITGVSDLRDFILSAVRDAGQYGFFRSVFLGANA